MYSGSLGLLATILPLWFLLQPFTFAEALLCRSSAGLVKAASVLLDFRS